MKIDSIRATGIKGKSFNHDLQPLTWITGDNGAGKTAIVDSILLAIKGRHPALGSRAGELMKLASSTTMETQATLSSGERMTRRWISKGAGTTTDHDVKQDGNGMTTGDLIPDVCLDFGAFLTAKPTERQRILEAAMGTLDPGDQLSAMETKLAELPELARNSIPSAAEIPNFQALETAAREGAKAMGQDEKRITGALQQNIIDEATQEAAGDGTTPQQLGEAESNLMTANQRVGELSQRLDGISDRMMKSPDCPSDPEPSAEMLQQLAVELEQARNQQREYAEAARANQPVHSQIAITKANVITLETSRQFVGQQPTQNKPTEADMAAIESAIIDGKHAVIKAQQTVETLERGIQEARNKREKLLAAECCPTCGTAGNDLKAAIETHFDQMITSLTESLHEGRGAIREVEEKRVEVEKNRSELTVLREAWDNYERAQALVKGEQELETLKGQLKPYPAPPAEEPAAIERKMDAAKAAQAEWKAYRDYEAPSAELQQHAIAELEQARAALVEAKAQYDTVKLALSRKGDALERIRARGRYEQELEQVKIANKALKELADWAKGESLAATAAAMKPIIDPANRILEGVLDGALKIDGTDVGVQTGEQFRPIEVLSGAEAAILAIALQAALSSQSPVKIIIADELSRLTQQRRMRLMHNLRAAIADGMIEQVIALDHDAAFVNDAAAGDDTVIICGNGKGQP